MVNEAIYELTQEPSLNAADRFVVQQTSAATRATSATFALMGGLELDTTQDPTTGNITAAVGKLYHSDVSGMTADRTFILPDSAQVGERVGIFLEAGDATYELDIVTAAVGSLINGADAGSGTSWSRLFITNECCVFRCIKAGGAGDTDWIVEYDGRIPCYCSLEMDTVQAVDPSTLTTLEFDTVTEQRGDCQDTTNYGIAARRPGLWDVSCAWITYHNVAADATYYGQLSHNGGSPASRRSALYMTDLTKNNVGVQTQATFEMATGDYVYHRCYVSAWFDTNKDIHNTSTGTYLCGSEIL